MITFSKFLQQYQEIITLDNINIEKNIKPLFDDDTKKGFKYNIDGNTFWTYIRKKELHVTDSNYQKIIHAYINAGYPAFYYEIYFTNPDGSMGSMALQNKYGTKATEVYNFVVIAVKKSIEKFESQNNPVNVLNYFGYDSITNIIYEKFYNQFLKDKYIRISSMTLLKKEIFENLLKQQPNLGQDQKNAEDYYRDELKSTSNIRKYQRDQRKQKPPTES